MKLAVSMKLAAGTKYHYGCTCTKLASPSPNLACQTLSSSMHAVHM